MAPLVSPFCSPLSSTSLERAGVPAGKQSRPIVAQPYPRWTNRERARRAKMNGSLSPSVFLSLRSSLFRLYFGLSYFTWVSRTSRSLARVYPACSVRPIVRTSVRLLPVQSCSATLPYTLQRSNVSHGIFSPSLGYFTCLYFVLSLSLPFSFSFFLSLNAIFPSRSYVTSLSFSFSFVILFFEIIFFFLIGLVK